MTQAEALTLAAAAAVGVGLAVYFRDDLAALWGDDTPDDQTASLGDRLALFANPSDWFDTMPASSRNRRAFLDMISYSEGTGGRYDVLFGWPGAGRTFSDYSDHPRRFFAYRNTRTSAAGKYQITATTYDATAPGLGLDDFGPRTQDAIALELIRQRGALADVDAGRFADAVSKVRRIWASLPGAGYGQPERKLETLASAYTRAGGTITA